MSSFQILGRDKNPESLDYILNKRRRSEDDLIIFSEMLIKLSNTIGFKVSARGWCYLLETERYINKNQFDKAESLINKCRKTGHLPIDFVAEDKSRSFLGVDEGPTDPFKIASAYLEYALDAGDDFNPDWWNKEKYYIQMIVEKVDLVTLFNPVCRNYKIPIANSKGWSSILQRALYAKRFKEAEKRGLQCVLLYCGDHDPDGLRISEFLRENLYQISDIQWSNGESGYSPDNLIIERFGLNHNYILENELIWIDNLITGSGKDLSDPYHRNHNMEYVQDYMNSYGIRKVEANAIVKNVSSARLLCKNAIEKYLGESAILRFQRKREKLKNEFNAYIRSEEIDDEIYDLIQKFDNYYA